jgi:photosystem II stability/assembly factor-like uncharacterized protein
MRQRLLFFLFFITQISFGQILQKPSAVEIAAQPEWAQLMYEDDPNVFAVDAAFKAYYREYILEKNYHTKYYKKWRRFVDPYIQADGHYVLPDAQVAVEQRESWMRKHQQEAKSGNWSLLGPVTSYRTNGEVSGQQTNIYSLDQSLSHPNVLYAGTEPGEIYRSDDEGQNWRNICLNDPLTISTGIDAIKIHPTNPDLVLAASGSYLFRTTNGGDTWDLIMIGFARAGEIAFVPSSPDVVLMAAFDGVYRSINAGQDWDLVSPGKAWDLKLNTANDSIVYVAKSNATGKLSEFYISEDMGQTFAIQTNGWHTSTDSGRNDGGVRLAVTEADPNRVYAYLIGESKTDDSGFIGLYRSDDGGHTWVLPNGPAGGPYNENHINLAVANTSWNYHQGYYNCALMCSNSNADEILVGGLSLYKSYDAGASFTAIAGYASNTYDLHVDMQDFRSIGNVSWITTDGGIYRSTDFFNSDAYTVRMTGIHGADYWGFGQGWNEDVTVGGLYHNGVHSSFDVWGQGDFLQLGGGEPASGYVNPGEGRRVYSTQLGGRILPLEIGEEVTGFQFGINPNESYWGVESSELEFDPRTYSTAYTGKDHQLWKSTDLGITFNLVHAFGANENSRITYIEIAWSNPDVMYVCQQMSSGNLGKLWKTTDGGENWTTLSLPVGSNTRKMLVQVDPEDENNVYIAFQSTGNGQRVYKSTDGGQSWTNWTTPTLDGQNAKYITYCAGTDGGVYYATNYSIYYRNNNMEDWEHFADGLPVEINSNIARIFYRDSKIRLASYGKGIWESPLYEMPSHPIAQISVDRLVDSVQCEIAPFHYVDHSIVNHNGTTWQWEFQGGEPATATGLEADVMYSDPGTYLTILTVTDILGNEDVDSLYINVGQYEALPVLAEDFEGSFPPNNFVVVNSDQGITWQGIMDIGGFGASDAAMMINNFDYNAAGQEDDIQVLLDMSNMEGNAMLSFDVAYTLWGGNYSDSLEVLISTDCGANFASLYFRGGEELATRPAYTDPYFPAADEWRTDSLDLTNYIGNESVLLAFRNHTGFGNNLFVDNINLTAEQIVAIQEAVSENDVEVFPNPLRSGNPLNIVANGSDELWIDIYSANGKMIYKALHSAESTVNTAGIKPGVYLVVMRSTTQIRKQLIVIQ